MLLESITLCTLVLMFNIDGTFAQPQNCANIVGLPTVCPGTQLCEDRFTALKGGCVNTAADCPCGLLLDSDDCADDVLSHVLWLTL